MNFLSLNAADEKALREYKVPMLDDINDVADLVGALINREHDYGTSVYAMSIAATAVYSYVAHVVGASGFQASLADLDILRRTRMLDGPFMIVDLTRHLFPQYDVLRDVKEALTEQGQWFGDEARRKLAAAEHAEIRPHPDVIARWETLSHAYPPVWPPKADGT